LIDKDSEFRVFINIGYAKLRIPGRVCFTMAHEFTHYSIRNYREVIIYETGIHKSSFYSKMVKKNLNVWLGITSVNEDRFREITKTLFQSR